MKWLLRKANAVEAVAKSNVIDIKTALPVVMSEIESHQVQTVNARDVHAFLGVNTRFNDWIANRISEFGFTVGLDFTEILVKQTGPGRPSTDYALTLSMAKELCMVERNEQGKKARQYFIECERRALAPKPQTETLNLTHFRALLETAERSQARVVELEAVVNKVTKEKKELEPKAETYDAALSTKGLLCVTDAGKQLGIAPRKFVQFLIDEGLCYRRKNEYGEPMHLVPYSNMVTEGFMTLRERKYGGRQKPQTYITFRGLCWLERKLKRAVRKAAASEMVLSVPRASH